MPASNELVPTEQLIFGSFASHRRFEEIFKAKQSKKKIKYRPSLESSLEQPSGQGKKISMKLIEREEVDFERDYLRASNRMDTEMMFHRNVLEMSE